MLESSLLGLPVICAAYFPEVYKGLSWKEPSVPSTDNHTQNQPTSNRPVLAQNLATGLDKPLPVSESQLLLSRIKVTKPFEHRFEYFTSCTAVII